MALNFFEQAFYEDQTVVVTMEESVSSPYFLIQNQGRNVVLIQRIILFCKFKNQDGYSITYLRYSAPPPFNWEYPSPYLEPGRSASYFQLTNPDVEKITVKVEYVEIDGRCVSKDFKL